MNPISTIQFIASHPFSRHQPLKGISRYIGWQLRARLTGWPKRFQFTPNAKMWLAPGLRSASGNYYCGLHEYADMAFVLHYLRQDDMFVDIGANVGSYTLLAAAECGARVKAYEPVPSTFQWLARNVTENAFQKQVEVFNHALGAKNGTVSMTSTLDAQNHLTCEVDVQTVTVPIKKLDDSLAGEIPALMKIDVEGAEDGVLAGAQNTIRNSGLRALIIEMTNKPFPDAPALHCHEWLLQQGFGAYCYEPNHRILTPLPHPHGHNTIYIRDLNDAEERLKRAPKRKIWRSVF